MPYRTAWPSFSLPVRLSLVGTGLLSFVSICTVGLILRDVEADMTQHASAVLESNMRLLRQTLADEGGSDGFSLVDGQLQVGSHRISQNDPAVDRVQAIIGGTATVFLGDTRIATNVTKPDGTRAIGTKPAMGPVYDAMLKQGRPFSGKAEVLGVPYFTAYDPIPATDGRTIGVLYTGVKQADYLAVVSRMRTEAILIGVLLAAGSSAAFWFLVRRSLKPLKRLEGVMRHLASGDAAVEVSERRSGNGRTRPSLAPRPACSGCSRS